MKIKTIYLVILIGLAIILISGCATTNAPHATVSSPEAERNQLNEVIRKASDYLNNFLREERGSTIVIIAAHSNHWGLSNNIINGLSRNAVNDRTFRVADRTQLGDVELRFQQSSGRVSDETLLSLTRVTGASVFFAIDITRTGNEYTLNLRAVDIETQLVAGHEIFYFQNTQFIESLGMRSAGEHISVAINVRGDSDGRIEKAFTEVLNSNGIRSTQSGANIFSLTASLELHDVESDDPRFAYVRYILNYSLRHPSMTEIFSKTINERVGHRNRPEAVNRALQMVEHSIKTDSFAACLTNNISRL
jgi:hypothetical protein